MKSLTVILVFFSLSTNAQYEGKQAIIRVDSSVKLIMYPVPFAGVKIIDARFDQTHIGYAHNTVNIRGISTLKHPVNFPDSLQEYLPVFLNKFMQFDHSSMDTLVILIKQFQITDHFPLNYHFPTPKLNLHFSATFLKLNGSYMPLFSISAVESYEVVKMREKKKVRRQEGTRAAALTMLLYRMFENRDWHAIQGSSFSPIDLQTALKKRFQLPVLQENPPTGLFMSFDDFIHNRPTRTDIRVVEKKDLEFELQDLNGAVLDFSSCWAVRENGKNYLVFRNKLAPLFRNDHSFRVLSFRTKAELVTVNKLGVRKPTDEGRSQPEYFDLDMDTGKVLMYEAFGERGENIKNEKLKKY